MPNTIPLLSEQQIIDALGPGGWTMLDDARAIESATRTPLLARIAELEEINGQLCGQNSVVDAACAEYEKVYAEALASLKAAVIERDEARAEVDQLRAQVAAHEQEVSGDEPPDGLSWFYCTTSVTNVQGWQRWRIAAKTLDEAKKLFNRDGGEFVDEELEVHNFDPPEWERPTPPAQAQAGEGAE
jgi:hypothetical protein